MKKPLLFALCSVFVASSASAELPRAPQPIKPLPIKPMPPLRLPKPPVRQCVDPAATAIDAVIVARTSRFAGTVRITGRVKNVGNAAYVSRPGQQIVQMWEETPGARPRLVAQQAFTNLAVGQEMFVSFARPWSSSDEFQPQYKVVITYDPDIFLDGNTKNDDCNMNNNARVRAPASINALFR
ncbi:MAG: hypothetical protein KC657_24720 [Myxococcales bacterium]|nr:hypothetical protein [Myxococcales bacterium]